MGVTLFGVVLSIGVSVAFGLQAEWWVRVLAGAASASVLIVVIKLGTAQGSKGVVARAADWITGSPERPGGSDG